ncbi:MAG: transposase, partial [Flavobacteriaceae bacterium]|nr:transposase [Flavobacteriaceae bacterium]
MIEICSYVEGQQNELAAFEYNRDRKRGKKQIVIGLKTDQEGCPVSVQIYKGNTSDPRTLSDQVTKLRETKGLSHVIMVGDRGILTHKGIQQELVPVGMDWISALRKETIASVVKQTKTVDLDKLDKQSLMEVQTDLFPQDRLIFCK